MMRWLHNKFWREHTPPCMECGWNMKSIIETYDRMEWKCVWPLCGWSTFQSTNGKLHWYRSKK